jgi:menaquinol-cytochrome c reductase iron-sulfur subunit
MSDQNSSHPECTSPNNPTEAAMPRRSFYVAVIYVCNAIMGIALAVPTLIYLLVQPKSRKQSPFVDAGDISQLAVGTPVEMRFQQSRIDGWRPVTEKRTAWVVKTPDNNIVAYGPQCTHLGCAYHWDDGTKQFVCPCHNSFFSIQGAVLAGPAPRPLDRYVTKIQDNRIQIGPLKVSEEAKG